uniref:C2H2-type domain-containing protein n=1 Tax=Clastoptera arizonana TaxID=38151 RepID=A0A1B6DSV5_9HEMI
MKVDSENTVFIDGEPIYELEIEEEIMSQDEGQILDESDNNFLFSNLCRFCTNEKGNDGKNIFEDDEAGREITKMINIVFPEKIIGGSDDNLHKSKTDILLSQSSTEIISNNSENQLKLKAINLMFDDITIRSCDMCSSKFTSVTALTNHKKKCHDLYLATYPKKYYSCRYCPVVFTSLSALQVHTKSKYLRERSKNNIHYCKDCGSIFKRKYLLRAHKRESHKNHICSSCGEAFLFRKSLAQHVQIEHKNTSCSECGKKFKTSYWRMMHEKTHETDNCHLCWICGKVCISKSSLRTHMSLHYSSKSYVCEVCNKELKSASGLKHHMQIHTDRERTFKCNICEKAFTSKVILKQHGLSHSGLKPYACSNCGTQFNRLSNLNYHIKHYCTLKKPMKNQNKKNNIPAYKCEVCKSTFTSKLSFKYHMSRHTGNKTPFDCEECGSAFSSVSNYRQHKRTHADDRPYVCEICGKTFKTKGTLNIHNSTHNNFYPYSCSECNRSFKRMSSLKLHQSVHTGGKPYQCGICYRPFTRKGDAKTHLSRCHKIELIKEEMEEVEYKYAEVVINANDAINIPVVDGEYVIQMADDVEIETSFNTV